MLVYTLISNEWLLRRFRTVEAQIWARAEPNSHSLQVEIALGQAFCSASSIFVRLQRRMDAAQRNYRNALVDLLKLQSQTQQPPAADPPSRTQSNQPVVSEIGFVPQPTPMPVPPLAVAPPPDPHIPIGFVPHFSGSAGNLVTGVRRLDIFGLRKAGADDCQMAS